MPTASWQAAGTTIAVDETGTGTYTLINQVTSIKGAGAGSVNQADTTWLSSSTKTSRPTIKDPGDLVIDLNFDPTDAVHKFLRNTVDAPTVGAPYSYKVVWPTTGTTSTMVILGNISDFGGVDAGDVEEILTTTITIKQTGLPTWVAAT